MNRTIFSLFALLTAFPVLISAVSDKSLFTLIFEGIQSHVTKNYEDRTKTEAAPAATLMSDCDCTEYLYLNDIALGEVHKFAVDPTTGDITEIGSPWMGGFDSPHGLGVDLNGFLYIGNHPSDGPIRKVTCDGNIIDADWNTTITGGGLTNIGSVGNFILANGAFESSEFSNIQVLDACSGDRLGSICLEGSNFGDWGMQVLNDGTVLVTEGIDIQLGFGAPATKTIWKFPFDENLIGNADPNCVTPFVQGGYLNDYEEIYGITSDDTHLYMVARKNGGNTFLVKVDATTGAFVAEINESTMSGTDGSNPGYNGARGIIYAPSSDKLYVSGIEDCISIVNPADLSYEGAGAGIVTNGEPKAIGILKECCPNVTPLAFNETICSDGNGERLFLQDFLNCGDGVICEGQWSIQTPNANQVFESCDLSITVNGSGCGTYVLGKTTGATGNQQCGAFQIEVQICTEVPGADNITPAQGTCTGTTPNDDATVNLTGVTGDEANISPGATYSGPAYGDASNTDVSSGMGSFTSLMHNTQYTIRFWNGSNGCFVDETVTTASANCGASCSLDEDFSFGCIEGPGGCNVEVETYVVNIPRAGDGRPQSPFVYNIPNNPTTGQFRVTARYITRDDNPGAAANGVDFNGVPGTLIFQQYGNDPMWAENYSAEFTTGNVATLTLDIDSDPVDADNLPGLEVVVFKCAGDLGNPAIAGAFVDERAWVGNGNGEPFCVTRTICLPEGSCNSGRELLISNGIFNVHQDDPCDRELGFRYTTDDGDTFRFLEIPVADNSIIEHTINITAATTSIEVAMCTWNSTGAGVEFNATCKGVSSIYGTVLVADACACSTTCVPPTAMLNSTQGTCTGTTPNDDAVVNLSGITGDEANISVGATYTGPAYGDAANTDVSGGTGSFTGLMHNTQYTLRFWNGSNDCFVDETVTTATANCAATSACDCKDYIYLNDTDGANLVHKFAIDSGTGALTEVGSPWIPMNSVADPHGLGIDLNGFLYIGEPGARMNTTGDGSDFVFDGVTTSSIKKYTCDGTEIDPSAIPDLRVWSANFFSENGMLYIPNSQDETIDLYELCTGTYVGSMFVDAGNNIWTWGFYIEDGFWYLPDALSAKVFRGSTDPALFTPMTTPNPTFTTGQATGTELFDLGFTPTFNTDIPMGLTRDDAGNYYLVRNHISGSNTNLQIRKYDPTGAFLTSITNNTGLSNNTNNGEQGYFGTRGLVYSSMSGYLYLSARDNCVAVFDTDLNEQVPLNIGNPANTRPKGIGLVTECCPTVNRVIDETVCSAGTGERFFLQDFVDCGDGTVCEGQWSEDPANSPDFVFNSCDLSVTVNGTGCASYVLEKTTSAAGNQQCGPFEITLNICTSLAAATVTGNAGTCNGSNANDDATATLTTSTGDQAGISLGATYTGADYGDTAHIDVSSGTGTFTGLMHNTQYTVRTFNGSNDCFTDETFTMPDVTCVQPLSLGNRVFFDDNNDGVQNGAESGIDGVTLQLLTASGAIYDSDPDTPGVQGLTVTTANGGYYRFDDLLPGSYIVEVLPSNFGGALENYGSSTGAGQEADPDSNGDTNDNGLDTPTSAGAIRSGVVTLSDSEPTGEAEPGAYGAGSTTGTAAADDLSNLTVDFGFQRLRDNPDYEDPQNPCPQEPCHFISNSVYLGSGVSSDNDTNNTSTADTDTDDGVALGSNLNFAPGGTINFPVTIFNSSGNDVFLFAWVDWNGDGDFDDTGEQISNNSYNGTTFSGTFMVNLPAAVPTDALQNEAFAARFRVSTDNTNANSPCGSGDCAADGEIEDYLLLIECPTSVCTPAEVIIIRN